MKNFSEEQSSVPLVEASEEFLEVRFNFKLSYFYHPHTKYREGNVSLIILKKTIKYNLDCYFLEHENEMVALIPFSDKRLKPRRTYV